MRARIYVFMRVDARAPVQALMRVHAESLRACGLSKGTSPLHKRARTTNEKASIWHQAPQSIN